MFELTTRMRWLIGGGTVVAAGAIVAAAMLVLGSRPVPEAMTYVPRDSAVVAELRPDLPGDQLSKIGNLLAHFPGFKDQSILAQKIDEALAKVTKSATNGSVDYATQVKPWIAGPLFAGAAVSGPTPSASAPAGSGAAGSVARLADADYVVVFSTDGSVTCQPITHGSTSSEPYRGVQISGPVRGNETGASCAIDGRQALIGSAAGIKTAIDAHLDHQGIDGQADYKTARDRLGGDRLATLYVSRNAMAAGLQGRLESAIPTLEPALAQAVGSLPAWAIAGVRAEDNALVADIVTAPFNPTGVLPGISLAPGASLLTPPPAHASQLASLVPGDTALLYELHGGGVALQNALTEVRSAPGVGGSLGNLDATLATLGGVAGLVGWVGDAGVAILPDGASATGGLVLLAPDPATASAKAQQIRGLLSLAGLGGSIKVTDTTVDGTTVTLVDLGDAATLLGSLGSLSPGTPGAGSVPPGTHVVVSLAVRGSAVLIGSGESFARRIIETASGSTLADQASYRSALALASSQNDGQLYVAAAPVLVLAEGAIPATDKVRFESDVKPYLSPFDAILETTTLAADGSRVRIVLTVK